MSKKILVQTAAGANYYIRNSLCNGFIVGGEKCYYWNPEGKSPFDIFSELEPDIAILDTWQLNRALVKNLINRPHVKVLLFGESWGDINGDLDIKKYPVAFATDDQKKLIEELIKGGANLKGILSQHNQRSLEWSHAGWAQLGLSYHSIMVSADVVEYYPTPLDPVYNCDIAYLGNYWKYKADSSLDRYLMPLCYPNTNWSIKIFGSGWNCVNYLGTISTPNINKFYRNAKIVPSFAERHSVEVYGDIPLRFMQVSASFGFQLAENVIGLDDIYPNGEVVTFENPKDFFDKCVYYLNNPDESIPYRQKALKAVMSGHTNLHRCKQLMNILEEEADGLDKAIENNNRRYLYDNERI
jgi:Glycosyl transferases group 1